MHSPTIPFRLVSTQREEQLAQFNARKEIAWFGFRGAFKEPGLAIINFTKIESGLQEGGGISAINGGVIATGFDAARWRRPEAEPVKCCENLGLVMP